MNPASLPRIDLIDSHGHLTFEPLDRCAEDVLNRARAVGVRRCITIGTDLEDSRRAVEMAGRHEGVWATAGIHPHQAGRVEEATWRQFEALLAGGGVVAVGETGLDFHYAFSDRASQQDAFVRQIALAERYGLPLVIHCRQAVEEALEILARHGHRSAHGVFHCFTGTRDEVRRILEAGWYVSLSGIVTFKNAAALREAAAAIPLDRLLIETDAPYNSPEPVRKVRPNEPAHLVHTCRFLADLYRVPPDELAARCNRAAEILFGLKD